MTNVLIASTRARETTRSQIRVHKRSLQIVLGVIWLIDAVLQFQPWMFTKAFSHTILVPAALSMGPVVGKPDQWLASLVGSYPQVNIVFAVVQLAIAIGFFNRKTVKVALLGSVLWGLGVWYSGDGLGGILSGGSSILTGFPTAPLLYSIVSIALWPSDAVPIVHGTTGLLAKALAKIDIYFEKSASSITTISWSILWVLGPVYQILSGNDGSNTVSQAISSSASSSPLWLHQLDNMVGAVAGSIGSVGVYVLLGIEIIIGVGVLSKRWINAALVGGSILSFVFWIFGQSLGALTTGQSTDLNSAPLFILMAAVIYFYESAKRRMTLRENAGVFAGL